MGSGSQGNNSQNTILNLDLGEDIAEVFGRTFYIIVYIKISTSYDQKIEFENIFNTRSLIFDFGGGINDLHNI